MLTLGAFGDIQLMWLAVNLGYILYFFDEMPPWIVAVASICGTQTHVQIFATDGHRASARAVCILQLVSPLIAVLFVLLSASIRPGCIAHMYLIQLSWYLQGFQNSHPWIVAGLSDWENMVCNTWARGSGSAMYTVGTSDIKVSLYVVYGSDNELEGIHVHRISVDIHISCMTRTLK